MAQNHVKTVGDFYAAISQGDLSCVALDSEIEWIEPDTLDLWFSGTHHGPDGVRRDVIEPTFQHFDDFHVQCDQFLDAGEHVVVTGHFEGRAKATGILLNSPFAHIWTFQGDKAVRFQDYTDTANWLYALYRIQVEHPVGV